MWSACGGEGRVIVSMVLNPQTCTLHTKIETSVSIVVIVKLVETIAVTAVSLKIPVVLERF